MKENLRKRLISRIEDLDERIQQLKKYRCSAKEANNFKDAMTYDIKYQQLKIVSEEFKKLLD
tara:strand:+ start:100 stop:285 length:186 start_codon:yes stop_codon:yes gene_type:complete